MTPNPIPVLCCVFVFLFFFVYYAIFPSDSMFAFEFWWLHAPCVVKTSCHALVRWLAVTNEPPEQTGENKKTTEKRQQNYYHSVQNKENRVYSY